MKPSFLIRAGLAAVAVLVSCTKTIDTDSDGFLVDEQPVEGMTFSATLNPQTRSRFADDSSPALEWENDEPVMIAALRFNGLTEDMFDGLDDETFTTILNTLIVTDIGHADVNAEDKSQAIVKTSKTQAQWLYSPNPDPDDTYLFFAYYPVTETKPMCSQHSGELWYEFEIPTVQDGRSYWKYQLFFNYILDVETENFSTYYTRAEIEGGTEIAFDNFQPVNTLLRFRLKLPDGASGSHTVSKIVLTASGTDRAIVGKCTSNIVENWLNPASEGASLSLTLDLDEPVTVTSTVPDDYLFASIISQKDNGFSGTFDLTFTAYDENGWPVLRATKTSPDGGLSAGNRYTFDLTMEEVAIPDNEIWYTTASGTVIEPFNGRTSYWHGYRSSSYTDATLISNTYDGIGILRFNENLVMQDANAFEANTELTGIKFPDGMKRLDSRGFYGCSNLKNVILPASLTFLGASIFQNCISLTSLVIPACNDGSGPTGYPIVQGNAFTGCAGLETVTFLTEAYPPSLQSPDPFTDTSCLIYVQPSVYETVQSWNNNGLYWPVYRDAGRLRSL